MVLQSQVLHKQFNVIFEEIIKKSDHQILGNLRGSQDLPRPQGKSAPLQVWHAGHPGQDTCWLSLHILSGLYFP